MTPDLAALVRALRANCRCNPDESCTNCKSAAAIESLAAENALLHSCTRHETARAERAEAEHDALRKLIVEGIDGGHIYGNDSEQWLIKAENIIGGPLPTESTPVIKSEWEQLIAERDALVAKFSEIAPCDPGDTSVLIAARALVKHRELRKDAERYRWLRSELKRVDPLASIVWKHNDDRTSNEWANIGIVDHLDAGIDAAIDAALAGKAER